MVMTEQNDAEDGGSGQPNQTRIMITGADGQLGRALARALTEHELIATGRSEVDVTDRDGVRRAVRESEPQIVVHCAAYTDVDGCARHPERAQRVNALGAQNVALACREAGAEMVHISTNEVFAGDDAGGYEEWRPLNPMNPYARSKAAAEFHVRHLLPRHYIVRTAWTYAPGGRNFVHTILRYARERGELRVVTDEIANPTYVKDVAEAIDRLIQLGQSGTYHFVNAGACSRWAFANEILRLAGLEHVTNRPILSVEFNRASTPPRYGALQNTAGAALGIVLRPWQEALADFMDETGDLAVAAVSTTPEPQKEYANE
ncbi:MAG: dTDP-4-dehydrorhamnose reductase [Candidatus Promineifilaceae bacterium]|nr:dTDP-4-dehydrorhamnose reductase [Candidatus Promineifilaceae bacterium]